MEGTKSVRNSLRRWVITGGLTAAMLLGGCGQSDGASKSAPSNVAGGSASYAATADEAYYGEMEMPAEAYMVESGDIYQSSGSFDEAAGLEIDTPQATSRKLIRNISLEVETQEFQTLISTVTDRVKSMGGYIENSNIYNGSNYSGEAQRYATMTLRIPSTKADTFLTELDDQSNITQQNENVEDVTLAYVDLESHKKVLLAEQENLIEMLEMTNDIDDMITLENRISNLRYQIESMESQLRTYDNKVDYTTINLHVSEVVELTEITEPEPEPADPTTWERISEGFADNLDRVITSFTDLLVAFLSNLPSLLVWAVIIFIAVKIVKKVLGAGNHQPAVAMAAEGDASATGEEIFGKLVKGKKRAAKAAETKTAESAQSGDQGGFHWPDGDNN